MENASSYKSTFVGAECHTEKTKRKRNVGGGAERWPSCTYWGSRPACQGGCTSCLSFRLPTMMTYQTLPHAVFWLIAGHCGPFIPVMSLCRRSRQVNLCARTCWLNMGEDRRKALLFRWTSLWRPIPLMDFELTISAPCNKASHGYDLDHSVLQVFLDLLLETLLNLLAWCLMPLYWGVTSKDAFAAGTIIQLLHICC